MDEPVLAMMLIVTTYIVFVLMVNGFLEIILDHTGLHHLSVVVVVVIHMNIMVVSI